MRTLKQPSQHNERDEGAVLIMVALLMVALIGIAAFVVDLGALYAEKRELQNGADAGALAVAQDCAQGNCALNGAPISLAGAYANRNANDASSAVDLVCGVGPGLAACSGGAPPGASGASGWVRVGTSTRTSGGGNQVNFLLAPVMNGLAGATVRASAAAAWGTLGTGTVIPLTFSVCEWQRLGGSLANGTFPNLSGWIYFHGVGGGNDPNSPNCTASPSGQDLPGGFGFLDSSACLATITAGGWVGVDTGNNFPQGCDPNNWLNTEVLIAVYDRTQGNGNNGQYHIVGFVGFRMDQYKFNGNRASPRGLRCPNTNGNSATCVHGQFTRFTTDGGTFGNYDFGARVVKMVG